MAAPVPRAPFAYGQADPELLQAIGAGMQSGIQGPTPTYGAPDLSAASTPRPLGMFGSLGRMSTGINAVDQGAAPLGFATPKATDITGADPQKVHLRFFDKGGLGSKILNGLGEFALRYSASQGDPMALMTIRQRMANQVYQRDRADKLSDDQRDFEQQLMLERYRRSTPNDEFSHYLDAGAYSPEERTKLYRQRAESMANPTQWITADNGDGTKTVMPVPRFAPSPPGSTPPPSVAVMALRSNPALAADFDAKYGAGAAARVLGQGGAGFATPPTFR